MSLLTTITPYWNRPEMLRSWVRAVRGATCSELLHFVYFVGEHPPEWWQSETGGTNIVALIRAEPPGLSIGHYHNLGAVLAPTEWIMKLDVDTIPHQSYFEALLPLVKKAAPREWFNGGMFYLGRHPSSMLLADTNLPLPTKVYEQIMANRRSYAATSYLMPAGSNFICRREDYLKLGGCDEGFRGYGWEDYQQIYMLQRHQLNYEPLPGPVTSHNVTTRCRDEISRKKARQLWERDNRLCLIHKWHATAANPANTGYFSSLQANRDLLFKYVCQHRIKT